jgi:hypothetical protein
LRALLPTATSISSFLKKVNVAIAQSHPLSSVEHPSSVQLHTLLPTPHPPHTHPPLSVMPAAPAPTSPPQRDAASTAQKSAFGKKVAKYVECSGDANSVTLLRRYARGQAQGAKGVKDKKLNSRCVHCSPAPPRVTPVQHKAIGKEHPRCGVVCCAC